MNSLTNAVEEVIEVTEARDSLPPCRVLVTSGPTTNPGKSAVARHIIKPILAKNYSGGARFIAIEDKDRLSNSEDVRYSIDEIPEMLLDLGMTDDDEAVVTEIGAELFSLTMESLALLDGNKRFTFDKVIVPVPYAGDKKDVMMVFMQKIIKSGVDPKTIYVIFNHVPNTAYMRGDFEKSLTSGNGDNKLFVDFLNEKGINVCPTPIIQSDIFKTLRNMPGDNFSITAFCQLEQNHFLKIAKRAKKMGDDNAADAAIAIDALHSQAANFKESFSKIYSFIFE